MLAPRQRLKSPGRFRAALRGVRLHSCAWFMVLALPRREGEATRAFQAGFVVSKKVDKRAVVRNRIKRQLRHALRQLLQQEESASGWLGRWHTWVVLVKPACPPWTYAQLFAELAKQTTR
ncbi:MAG: ribonuclease P protein component [Vampirovibrionales bacterium]|nr:ribonuclease P protein component [Vampirovibrionales bacterium]